jgi:hypothetical protein
MLKPQWEQTRVHGLTGEMGPSLGCTCTAVCSLQCIWQCMLFKVWLCCSVVNRLGAPLVAISTNHGHCTVTWSRQA